MFKPAEVRDDGSYTLKIHEEEWRWIPEYEGMYAVSNYGEVYAVDRVVKGKNNTTRCIKGHMKKLHINSNGYLSTMLYKDNKYGRRSDVHYFVAKAFIGPVPEGMEICHNNGDRLDPSAWGLRYDSRLANQADRIKHGTDQIGIRNPSNKYTEEQVKEVKKLLLTHSQSETSRITGIHNSTVGAIKQGVQWKHINI